MTSPTLPAQDKQFLLSWESVVWYHLQKEWFSCIQSDIEHWPCKLVTLPGSEDTGVSKLLCKEGVQNRTPHADMAWPTQGPVGWVSWSVHYASVDVTWGHAAFSPFSLSPYTRAPIYYLKVGMTDIRPFWSCFLQMRKYRVRV